MSATKAILTNVTMDVLILKQISTIAVHAVISAKENKYATMVNAVYPAAPKRPYAERNALILSLTMKTAVNAEKHAISNKMSSVKKANAK
jgi:hypothetical protein